MDHRDVDPIGTTNNQHIVRLIRIKHGESATRKQRTACFTVKEVIIRQRPEKVDRRRT